VARADAPEGPFRDTGTVLVPDQDFTIDAHPFRDEDGTWWLFYCRDFLEGDRVGTGIVVDRMLDMTTLAGEARVAVRPHADWNLFEARRRWRGRVWDWYTVEGPHVRRRDGRYWLFFSGGAWPKPGYGLGCAVAERVAGPYVTTRTAHGPDLLRTVPGAVVGPGHASVATAPDGQDYLVYHAWDIDGTARRMRIDRLDWSEDGPSSNGPTLDPQPVPASAGGSATIAS
jgi:GH43 family beta-xylosidase